MVSDEITNISRVNNIRNHISFYNFKLFFYSLNTKNDIGLFKKNMNLNVTMGRLGTGRQTGRQVSYLTTFTKWELTCQNHRFVNIYI